MLTTFVVALAFAAAPTARVASIGFKAVGVDEQKAQFFASDFALKLQAATGIAVVSPEEITAVLGVERQRQLLGCSEDATSCLTELAGGLGANAVLQGTIARVGDSWALTIKLIDMKSAGIIAAKSGQVSREADVLEWLSQTARELGPVLRQRLVPDGAPRVQATTSAEGGLKRLGWIPAVAGGVLTVTGGILLGLAQAGFGAVARGDASITSASALEATLQQATTQQTFAFVSLGVAAAAWLTAAGFWVFGDSSSGVTVSVLAAPHLTGLVLGGQW